ncbi:MAG: tetratricopeptide repeat protein [Candidatus Omnitrophota bacterium]|jgi:tetratricopeptide (TPR) repeat protein
MSKKLFHLALFVFLPFFLLSAKASFASSPATEYLCELGATFYNSGKFDDALSEFNKVLLVEPDNKVAKQYINKIFEKNMDPSAPSGSMSAARKRSFNKYVPVAQEYVPALPEKLLEKDEIMERTMLGIGQKPQDSRQAIKDNSSGFKQNSPGKAKEDEGIKAGPFKISGETQVSFGATPDDFIWKRANFSLNDKSMNWRLNSTAAFDNKFNTYDPAIYDSLILNVDTENKEGFNFHTNITVDPWSYTGKSSKTTITGSNGDTADVQLYYWSNTGYTVNKTVYTSLKGDTINIPELKVYDGITKSSTLTSTRYKAIYTLSSLKIDSQFQPLREVWLDYTNDQMKFRAFPMSYQDQAYTSDDPLNITNHGIWWKDSKWLRNYTSGTYNSEDTTPSYTKGRWDDSLSFLSKDSTGRYLTALRGFSFNFNPDETTSFDATVVTPKNLWQDYNTMDNIIAVTRLKHHFSDRFMIGGTFTSRTGFLSDSYQKIDSQNYVGGVDLGYELVDGMKAQGEVLISNSKYDMSSNDYNSESRGNAYFFSIINRYPLKSIMDLSSYDDIAMDKDESFLLKSKIYGGHMDEGFDSALSDFHNTRQDTFWSRHIHFRKILDYYSHGMEKSGNNWGELNATRIGDGLDVGRNTLGFRLEYMWEDKFYNLFDVRNVHKTNGKFVENVARDEATIKVTDKLTAKGLGIYQKMPHTVGGIDPFVYDGDTGEYYLNSAVKDGEDPSIKTGSFGLNYNFFDWLSLNGVYERTNDYTIAYDNFPQSVLLNNTTLYGTYYQNSKLYRYILPYLYNQGIFPQAPYQFYNVFKCGLRFAPTDKFEIYLDYTRNEFEAASLNSDGMNHIGIEFAYMPSKKFGMVFKYIYSRSQDIDKMQNGDTKMYAHHNFSNEFRYMPSKNDEFVMQYGVGDAYSISNLSSLDPYGGGSLTLDTQHIIRAYYRHKF